MRPAYAATSYDTDVNVPCLALGGSFFANVVEPCCGGDRDSHSPRTNPTQSKPQRYLRKVMTQSQERKSYDGTTAADDAMG